MTILTCFSDVDSFQGGSVDHSEKKYLWSRPIPGTWYVFTHSLRDTLNYDHILRIRLAKMESNVYKMGYSMVGLAGYRCRMGCVGFNNIFLDSWRRKTISDLFWYPCTYSGFSAQCTCIIVTYLRWSKPTYISWVVGWLGSLYRFGWVGWGLITYCWIQGDKMGPSYRFWRGWLGLNHENKRWFWKAT